ncbi:MAG: recombinase family protein [Oscillospiraceae bacterium]|nr:recombinase family protein [Oscillospiraceae bacterium]
MQTTAIGTVLGYARVSAIDQHLERQLIALTNAGVPAQNIYVDKQSGKDFARPVYRSLTERLERGDVLYVLSIDRFGRNYEEIQNQWRIITKEIGADVVVLDMPLLDTRREKNLLGAFIADLILQVLSFCAENERNNIKARQAAGIAAAQANGVRFGRPSKPAPAHFGTLIRQWDKKQIALSKVLEECRNISESTFYRLLREHRCKHEKQR